MLATPQAVVEAVEPTSLHPTSSRPLTLSLYKPFFRGLEKPWRYKLGGYHPIKLHDQFKDGRYVILQNLGSGSYATDWLARNHQENRLVFVKCITADGNSEEVEIQRYLNQRMKQGGEEGGYRAMRT
ncbi:hypothetical protein BDD12DRAFT_911436 [Trichophaea hybrida]|nr:hypothetical protein BDD12DRAFT_911436 [Trichophaea hybrida]